MDNLTPLSLQVVAAHQSTEMSIKAEELFLSDFPKLKRLDRLVTVLSVPELIADVEENPIHADNFRELAEVLQINFPIFLDTISELDVIRELNTQDDCDVAKIRLRLIMLMCEHAPISVQVYPPYAETSRLYWTAVERICTPFISSGLLVHGLDVYKEKLLNNGWRRALGTAHGFVYFCELYLRSRDIALHLQTVLFILSIASQFVDCLHTEIKLLALRLYGVILKDCQEKLVLESNIHKVIIKSCLENSQKLFNDDCLVLLWDVVTQALCIDERIIKDYSWNELDDSLQLLFERIKLQGKRSVREQLRKNLSRIIIRCSAVEEDRMIGKDLGQLKELMVEMDVENIKLFRWLRDLKELFIIECLSISDSSQSTEEVLLFIGTSYLLTIFGVTCKSNEDDFIKRITPLLLEIYNLYRSDQKINTTITTFLQILLFHLNRITPENTEKTVYHQALEKLIKEI